MNTGSHVYQGLRDTWSSASCNSFDDVGCWVWGILQSQEITVRPYPSPNRSPNVLGKETFDLTHRYRAQRPAQSTDRSKTRFELESERVVVEARPCQSGGYVHYRVGPLWHVNK